MYLDLYAATAHEVTLADGTRLGTCSLACVAKLVAREPDRVVRVRVADFLDGGLVDAAGATYLEGSDVPGVMSYTSRIAFRSREEAVVFQKTHGGSIVTFREALEHQMEE